MADDTRGRPRRRVARLLRLHRPTWHDLHPLPAGWRPRTRVDVAGRVVEPWQWLVTDRTGYSYDGGEWWLPQGFDPDMAAHEVMTRWLGQNVCYLHRWEVAGLRCQARLSVRFDGGRVGVAYAQEQALTR